MKERIRIENLQELNIEDLIYICSSKRLEDPVHQHGIELKRQWLKEMLDRYGPCAKIAYYNERPVAQILYYPEEADATGVFTRKDVLVIFCAYNPTREAQKLGIGTRMLKSIIEDAKHRKTCLGDNSCKFILAKIFNTGELLSLREFYRRHGFISVSESKENLMYLPIEGAYRPTMPVGKYEPLSEDRGKAIVFYSPVCQFSYQFAKKIEGTIREIAPEMKVEMINKWKRPKEATKRKNQSLIVNAKPIQTFFMEKEKFKEEIREAVS